jgi:hypothetical protein
MKRNLDIALIKRMVNKRGLCYTGNGAYISFLIKPEEAASMQIFYITGVKGHEKIDSHDDMHGVCCRCTFTRYASFCRIDTGCFANIPGRLKRRPNRKRDPAVPFDCLHCCTINK